MFDIISWWLAIANLDFFLPFRSHNAIPYFSLSENRLCTRKKQRKNIFQRCREKKIGNQNSLYFHSFSAVNRFDVTLIHSFVIETRVRWLFALGNLFLSYSKRKKKTRQTLFIIWCVGTIRKKKFIQSFRNGRRRMSKKAPKVPSQYLFCAWEIKRRYGHRYECERNKFHRDFLSDFSFLLMNRKFLRLIHKTGYEVICVVVAKRFFFSSASEHFSRSFCKQAQVWMLSAKCFFFAEISI